MNEQDKEKLDTIKTKWARGIEEGNLDKVLSLYNGQATLKPTLSDKIRLGLKEIQPYFEGTPAGSENGFLNKGISKVTYLSSFDQKIGSAYISMGQYTFQTSSLVKADYSFVYSEKENGELEISAHHSSLTYEG